MIEPLTQAELKARAEKLVALNVAGHTDSFLVLVEVLAADLKRVAEAYAESGLTLNPATVAERMHHLLERLDDLKKIKK